MDELDRTPYERVEAELTARGLNMAWLSNRLGHENTSRVGNWKKRGIPRAEFVAIGEALGRSADWVAKGGEPSERRSIQGSEIAQRIAQEFDLIEGSERQFDAFAKIIAVITRARGL